MDYNEFKRKLESSRSLESNRNLTKNINVNITENRATTDSSVALMNEFTEKAQNNIIKSIKIDNNTFKCVAIFYHNSLLSEKMASVHLHIKFILNERCYFFKETFDHYKFFNDVVYDEKEDNHKYERFNNDRAIKFIYEQLSKAIAQELIKEQYKVFESLIDVLCPFKL